MKTVFLQGKKIEREVYIRPPKETATNKVWKLQKCVYGLGDASRYRYLRVKEELINLSGNVSSTDPGIFCWKENNESIGILICHVDDIVYGGTTMFENSVTQKLKQIFKFGCEDSEVFTYIGIELQQNADYSIIIISQNSYTDSIKEIILDKERIKQVKDQLTEIERKDYRRAVGQFNWVSGISRPDISFYVCDASTKFQNATITDALKVNKVKHLKSTKSFIKVPKFDEEYLKLQLFTDASFNNLPNGRSQAGQILFLSDCKNNCFPLH